MIKKTKAIQWWIFAILVFFIFIVLQIPAAWLISKFYKNNQVLQNVSGNIWQGQADWRQGKLKGSLSWKTRPLDLFLLRLGANVTLHSGNTQLKAVVGYGLGHKIILQHINGYIAPETLKNIVDWQWPSNAIQLQDIQFDFKKTEGFTHASGQLQWAGGELIYRYAQRQEQINLPALKAKLSDENYKLMFDVRDQRDQKLIALQLDPNLMLDVQLTQRLLLNIPSYSGKAGLDTYVLSSRQPLFSGGF